MATSYDKMPGARSTGQGGGAPGFGSPVEPPPIIWDGIHDDPIESTYRKLHQGFYGEEDYEVELPYVESRYQRLADIVWGWCIFYAGCLIGFALGIAVGGGW